MSGQENPEYEQGYGQTDDPHPAQASSSFAVPDFNRLY